MTAERRIGVAEVWAARGTKRIVDVRAPGEFAAGHAPGAIHIPMEQLTGRLADLEGGGDMVLMCQSGQRAALCQRTLEARGIGSYLVSGGMNAWMAAGLPVVRSTAAGWALERQVRLAAGLMGLAGALLAVLANPVWVWLCAFVGFGLAMAGLTGLCPMANLLGLMPWNRMKPDRVA